MFYKVKPCVCYYCVVRVCDNGEEKIIDIFNIRANAELVRDILNTDLKNERYTLSN